MISIQSYLRWSWSYFVTLVSDLSAADISTKDLKEELDGDAAGAIYGDEVFPPTTAKLLCIGNTFNVNLGDISQVLLPRVSPVFTEGDMPSMCDLELTKQDAISNIK